MAEKSEDELNPVSTSDTDKNNNVKAAVKKVTGVKLTKTGKNNVKVSWKNIKGVKYKIFISDNNKKLAKIKKGSSKNVSGVKAKNTGTNKVKVTGLKAGKKYYVKVCAYRVVNGKKIYGKFSTVKNFKLK